jgi:hypothetical protein
MSNGNPITEWWVRLSGDDRDLRDACEYFERSEICHVELHEGGEYYLKTASLNEGVDAREVMTRAENLVALVNGALMALLFDFEPIIAEAPVSIHENGGRGTYILPDSAQIKLRGGRAKLTVSGMPEETKRPSDAEKWLALSERNVDVADMLTFLARETDWFDLYKAHEMVIKLIGGQRHSLWRAPREWVEREKDDQFKCTANWYRHSSAEARKSPVPMELNAARKYIRDLVRRVLAHQPLK